MGEDGGGDRKPALTKMVSRRTFVVDDGDGKEGKKKKKKDSKKEKKSKKESKKMDKSEKKEKKSKKESKKMDKSEKKEKKSKKESKSDKKDKKSKKSKSKKRSKDKDKMGDSSRMSTIDDSSRLMVDDSDAPVGLEHSRRSTLEGMPASAAAAAPPKPKEPEPEPSESETAKDEGSDDDAEMKALLDGFMGEIGEDSDSSSSSSSSSSGWSKRGIDIPDNHLDHIVLAAPELFNAIDEFEDKTGIEPIVTGNIRGLGIKTARVTFEGPCFIEIIAPDPDTNGPIGTLLRSIGLTGLVPFHWAIRTADAGALGPQAKRIGYTPDCIGMSGANQDGTPRRWEMLYLYGHRLRGICPFFINWDNSDHPCETMPIVGELIGLTIKAPADDKIHALMAHTKSEGFTLEEGETPHFELKFSCPMEECITFESDKMVGFRFPGFEDECGPIIGEAGEEEPDLVLPTV